LFLDPYTSTASQNTLLQQRPPPHIPTHHRSVKVCSNRRSPDSRHSPDGCRKPSREPCRRMSTQINWHPAQPHHACGPWSSSGAASSCCQWAGSASGRSFTSLVAVALHHTPSVLHPSPYCFTPQHATRHAAPKWPHLMASSRSPAESHTESSWVASTGSSE